MALLEEVCNWEWALKVKIFTYFWFAFSGLSLLLVISAFSFPFPPPCLHSATMDSYPSGDVCQNKHSIPYVDIGHGILSQQQKAN